MKKEEIKKLLSQNVKVNFDTQEVEITCKRDNEFQTIKIEWSHIEIESAVERLESLAWIEERVKNLLTNVILNILEPNIEVYEQVCELAKASGPIRPGQPWYCIEALDNISRHVHVADYQHSVTGAPRFAHRAAALHAIDKIGPRALREMLGVDDD